MTMLHRPWINGHFADSKTTAAVFSPFTGEKVAESAQADGAQLETAMAAATAAAAPFRRTSRLIRSRLLSAIAQGISDRRAEMTDLIVREAGKPRLLADAEVGRALITFTVAAEEAKRMGGEIVPVDIEAAGRAFAPAIAKLVPRGPVLAIAPFNFPLNLIAHKVAPALAVGAPVIVKPPPQAPGPATLLAEIFAAAAAAVADARESIPAAALQVISGPNEVLAKAVSDPRLTILSFTGSDKVGWMLQSKATKKRVLLELGGNAAVIVHSDADLARAAARSAFGGYAYAGQVCISAQRIFVQADVYDKFLKLYLEEVRKLPVGDPAKSDTIVGPMIDAANADRVMQWIREAQESGAKLLAGGTRDGNIITPAVLADVPPSSKLQSEEVFGPVTVIEKYSRFEDAVARSNSSRFGLQAGVFTNDLRLVQIAEEELEVGGVIVNEIPTYRADNMPYGGMKESGLGREGIRYAIQEFCEWRTTVHWRG